MNLRKSLLILVLVAIGVTSALWLWMNYRASLPSEESRGPIRVQPATAQIDATPNDFVTAVFTIKNLSDVPHSFQLEVTAPHGWEALNPLDTLALQGQSQQELFLTVQIPPATPAGKYTLAVSAKDSSLSALGRTQIDVASTDMIKLSTPTWQPFTKAGEEGAYPITVANRGNQSAAVRLTVVAPLSWQTRLSSETLSLSPGQSQVVELFMRPPGQSSASQGKITIQASSNKAQEQVSFTVVVLVP